MIDTFDAVYRTAAEDAHWQPWYLLKAMAELMTGQDPRHRRCGHGERAWWGTQQDRREWARHPHGGDPEVMAARYGLLSLPYTAALQMGLPWDDPPETLYDPAVNVRLALAYLRARDTNISLALSAYHATDGRTRRGPGGSFLNSVFVDGVWRIVWRLEHADQCAPTP